MSMHVKMETRTLSNSNWTRNGPVGLEARCGRRPAGGRTGDAQGSGRFIKLKTPDVQDIAPAPVGGRRIDGDSYRVNDR